MSCVDLFHPSSGVSYFPRSQPKDTEINKKEPAQKEKCDKNQPGLLTNADGYVKVHFSEFHTAVIHQSLEKLHCLWQCVSIWSHPRNMYNGLKSVVLDGRIPVKIIICCCHREVRSITFNYNQPIQQKLFDHTVPHLILLWIGMFLFILPSLLISGKVSFASPSLGLSVGLPHQRELASIREGETPLEKCLEEKGRHFSIDKHFSIYIYINIYYSSYCIYAYVCVSIG